MKLPENSSVSPKASSPRRLQGLSVLRVAAMFLVFYCHLYSIPSFRVLGTSFFEPVRVGAIGVSLFFVLSGFSMTYNHCFETYKGRITYFSEYWNRISKFYPTALCIFLLSIPLGFLGGLRNRMHLAAILTNFCLLEAWHDAWNISGVNWFLSALAFFYLMFPVLNAAMQRKLGFCVLTGTAVCFWIASLVGTALDPRLAVFFKTFPAFRVFEFVLGMAVGRWYIQFPVQTHRGCMVSGLSGLAWFFLALFLQRKVHGFSEIGLYTIWTPGSLALVFALAHPDICLEFVRMGRLIQFFASLSFAFFMFHYIALRLAHAALHVLGLDYSILFGLLAGGGVFVCTIVWAKIWTERINPILVRRFRALNPVSLFPPELASLCRRD